MSRRLLVFLTLLLGISGPDDACAQQQDSVLTGAFADSAILTEQQHQRLAAPDTGAVLTMPQGESLRKSITPQKTALYSAVIPGLGQIYNRHYWKVPVVYVGAGVAIYFLYDNTTNYNKYRRMYSGYLSNDPEALADMAQSNLTPEYVKYLQDYHRRYLDITVLATVLGYTLQVLDAAIFAHLKGFDISEDISLRMQPVAYPGNGMGIGLVMRF